MQFLPTLVQAFEEAWKANTVEQSEPARCLFMRPIDSPYIDFGSLVQPIRGLLSAIGMCPISSTKAINLYAPAVGRARPVNRLQAD